MDAWGISKKKVNMNINMNIENEIREERKKKKRMSRTEGMVERNGEERHTQVYAGRRSGRS